MRLIDSNELEERLSTNKTIWFFNLNHDGILKDIINKTPTIEERPQGKWVSNEIYQLDLRCSNCNAYALEKEDYPYKSKFCPHCGADMRGDKNV